MYSSPPASFRAWMAPAGSPAMSPLPAPRGSSVVDAGRVGYPPAVFEVGAGELDPVDGREIDVRDRRAVRIHGQLPDGYRLGASSRITVLVSRKGSRPSLPPSR